MQKAPVEVKDRSTIFDEILESKLSDEDKKPLRLLQEAQNISVAGTVTTAMILSVYFIPILRLLSIDLLLEHDRIFTLES